MTNSKHWRAVSEGFTKDHSAATTILIAALYGAIIFAAATFVADTLAHIAAKL